MNEFSCAIHGLQPAGCSECFEMETKIADGFREKIAKLEADRNALLEALSDMVAQHCYIEKSREVSDKFDVESNCLHANADAMRLLGKLGALEIDDRGMRVVFGKWPKVAQAKAEERK